VPSLAVPDAGADVNALGNFAAVQLFAERARAVRPDFEVTPANAEAVVDIVRHLDGIPLALELAAARVKVLSPEQIAARLSDRFRILRGGPRTALPRQQTLRAAMDWSYELLDDVERSLLRRLAVFMGSYTLDAVEAVCGRSDIEEAGVLDVVGRLVDKSLVVVVQGPGENRYRLLETVRQYGRERLEEPARPSKFTRATAIGACPWWKRPPITFGAVKSRLAGLSCCSFNTMTSGRRWSGHGAVTTPQACG
jgi:predicted ATPase